MRFGSLFAGIGGIDLGLERAGMTCEWQVEVDDYCRRVLAKHWPDVRRYVDIRQTHGALAHADIDGKLQPQGSKSDERRWSRDGSETSDNACPRCLPPVDLIAGGFPCQPHSVAGKRRGADDDRNLWPEFIRIVREARPRYVLAENVPGIITTYLDTVLSDLEGEGYTCGTLDLPAVAFDAPHRRHRIFVVAVASGTGRGRPGRSEGKRKTGAGALDGSARTGSRREAQADAEKQEGRRVRIGELPAHAGATGDGRGQAFGRAAQSRMGMLVDGVSPWMVEPDIPRVAVGVPDRVNKLRGLGNAVVPAVAQWIGRRILEHAKSSENGR